MTRTHAVALIVIATLALPNAAQLPNGLVRVPSDQVSGRTFTAADATFSIDAPSPDWVWAAIPMVDDAATTMHPQLRSNTYVAFEPASRTVFAVTVLRDGSDTAPNDDYMRGVGSGIARTSPKTGWNIADYSYTFSALPFMGSYRFSCTATSNAGVIKHRFGYIGGTTVKYHFECSAPEETEPASFTAFVKSFRLLQPKGAR